MTSLTVRPSSGAARRDAVESQVLAAVDELLAEGETFVGLSVATIAERAGVARSTFYVHFADKTELLVRLASASTADIFAAAEEWVESALNATDEASARAALEATCRRIVADYRAHANLLGAVQAATGYDPVVADFWFARVEQFVDRMAVCLSGVQAVGWLPDDVDVRLLSRMAAWSIERTVSQTVAHSGPDADDALARTLARGLWLMVFGDATT